MLRLLIGVAAMLLFCSAHGPSFGQQITSYTYDGVGRVRAVNHPANRTGHCYDPVDSRTRFVAVVGAGPALEACGMYRMSAPAGSSGRTSTGSATRIATANGAPVCRAARVVADGSEHSVPVRAYCVDPEGDALRVVSASTAAPGARVAVNLDGTVTVFGIPSSGEVALSYVVRDQASAAAGSLSVVRPERKF